MKAISDNKSLFRVKGVKPFEGDRGKRALLFSFQGERSKAPW